MLVSMKVLLDKAIKNNTAVAAINVSNMETIMALLEVANKKHKEVIIQVAPIQLEIQKISFKQVVQLVKLFLKDYKINAALHLDHATKVEECYRAIEAGFTSVMYDGSLGSYDENVKNTCEVIKYAREYNVTVEAELGKVGGTEGKESSIDYNFLTEPNQVKEFIKCTDVDCLAIAIGNAHGLYKDKPKLDFKRLEKINKIAGIPLVLHGGTGINSEDISKAIKRGIRKINFFTEIDRKYVEGFVEAYKQNNNIYMMAASEQGRQKMMIEIENKINLCSSIGNIYG